MATSEASEATEPSVMLEPSEWLLLTADCARGSAENASRSERCIGVSSVEMLGCMVGDGPKLI